MATVVTGNELPAFEGTQIKYRPEIDGLRAIAVVAVVLYHARLTWDGAPIFTGGFIGVDVFFVISGYLISGIILREIRAGEFSFARFYERRARRILPALFALMAATIPAAIFLMQPHAKVAYAGSALSALGFGSNAWFWLENSYTAAPSQLKPLLHTWSLSVEEQFYLVIPIALLIVAKLFRRGTLGVLVAGFALSLAAAQWASTHLPSANFYLLPTRAWELLAGAILAHLEMRKGRNSHPILNWLMPATGAVLIAGSIWLFNDRTPHPSVITVLPILGTALLIWFSGASDPVSRLMKTPVFVGIGLISYSLYLWHFPVFAFARIEGYMRTQAEIAAAVAIAVSLALAAFFLVERPCRDRLRLKTSLLLLGLLAAFAALVAEYGYLYWRNEKLANHVNISGWGDIDLKAKLDARTEIYDQLCMKLTIDWCPTTVSGKVNVLIVGDSMAPDALNIIQPIFPQFHYKVDSLGGCPPTPFFARFADADGRDVAKCVDRNRRRFSAGALKGVDVVVINTAATWFTPADLIPYLEFLKRHSVKQVIILGAYAKLSTSLPRTMASRSMGRPEDFQSPAYADLVERWHAHDAEFGAIAARFNYRFLSVREYACAPDCKLFVGDTPFTWDHMHFSAEFAGYLSERMRPELQVMLGDLKPQAE